MTVRDIWVLLWEPTTVAPVVLLILGIGVLACIGLDFAAGPDGIEIHGTAAVGATIWLVRHFDP